MARAQGCSIGIAALLLCATACGGQEPARSHPARDEPPRPSPPPTGAPVAISVPAWDGQLQVREGVLTVIVTEVVEESGLTEAPLVRCEEAARGDLAPLAGDEVVWRCFERDMSNIPVALAVTAGGAIVWTHSEFPFPDCYPEAIPISVVDAVPGAPRELLVRVLGCDWTGAMSDSDWLYAWSGDGLQRVAEARIDCDYMGDTSDPEAPEPPDDETWICGGQALELGGTAQAPTVTRVEVVHGAFAHGHRDDAQHLRFGPLRDGDRGREPLRDTDITRTVLRWDPSASLFAP